MLSDEKRAALNLRLMEEVNKAHDEYVAANTRFNSLVSEIPSGIPQPDGSLRIQKAGSETRRALEKYTRSMKLYTEFILNGIFPDDPQ